jgi:hypothetical protein
VDACRHRFSFCSLFGTFDVGSETSGFLFSRDAQGTERKQTARGIGAASRGSANTDPSHPSSMTSIARFGETVHAISLVLTLLLDSPPACSARSSRVRSPPPTFEPAVTNARRRDPVSQAHRDREIVSASAVSWGYTGSLTSHASFSFLDIGPLARGHSLVIPKCAYHLSIVRVVTWLTTSNFGQGTVRSSTTSRTSTWWIL